MKYLKFEIGVNYIPGTLSLWQPKKAPHKVMPRISIGHSYNDNEWIKTNEKGVEAWMK